MFLLDTNIISELRKRKPHGAVLAWHNAHPTHAHHLCSITVYELQAGAEITRLQDTTKWAELDRWIASLIAGAVILPLDPPSARLAAQLMYKQPRTVQEDAMIAAIAVTNGLTVATRNTRDFERFKVALVNPFEYKG